MIRTGRADVVVAGGTEAAIHPLPIAAFGNMMAMSKNNDDPQGASRPYDTGRDGFVLGEGAGVVDPGVRRARRRARRPGLRGGAWARACPPTATTSRSRSRTGRGIAAALQNLLDNTDLDPAEIVHVNAHATSTPQGDVAELKALRKVFGDDARPHRDLRDQVDDRAPAGWRGRCRDGGDRARAVPPGGSADDQRRRTSTPRRSTRTSCAVSRGSCRSRADRRAQRLVRVRWAQRGAGVPVGLMPSPCYDEARTPSLGCGPLVRLRCRRDAARRWRVPSRAAGCAPSGALGARSCSDDLVEPADRGALARVAEGLQLVVPGLAEELGDLGLQVASRRAGSGPGRRAAGPRGSGCRRGCR